MAGGTSRRQGGWQGPPWSQWRWGGCWLPVCLGIILLHSSDCSRKITSLIGSSLQQAVMRLSFIPRVLNPPLPSALPSAAPATGNTYVTGARGSGEGDPSALPCISLSCPEALPWTRGCKRNKEPCPPSEGRHDRVLREPQSEEDEALSSGRSQNYKVILLISGSLTHSANIYGAKGLAWRQSCEQKEHKYCSQGAHI